MQIITEDEIHIDIRINIAELLNKLDSKMHIQYENGFNLYTTDGILQWIPYSKEKQDKTVEQRHLECSKYIQSILEKHPQLQKDNVDEVSSTESGTDTQIKEQIIRNSMTMNI